MLPPSIVGMIVVLVVLVQPTLFSAGYDQRAVLYVF